MTMHAVYIGDKNDERFVYEGGDYNGNIPNRISPELHYSYEMHRQFLRDIKEGKFQGKQVDWGAYVGYLTPKQILEIADKQLEENDVFPHLQKKIQTFIDFAVNLDEDSVYPFVICEI